MAPALARDTAGLSGLGKINWNLRTEALYEASLRRGEVELAKNGPLVAITGQHTGRSPNDKFTVEESSSTDNIWWGKVNKPFPEDQFDALKQRLCEHLRGQEIFVQDCVAGADADSEIVVRVVTDSAWHALFARTMFIRPDDVGRRISASEPEFLIIHSPEFEADPARDGTNSGTFIVPNFGQRTVIIGGIAGYLGGGIDYVIQRLTDRNTGIVLDAWIDADGAAQGNAGAILQNA